MNRIVARNYEEARSAQQAFGETYVLAFDTETFGTRPEDGLSWYKQEVHGVSICNGHTVVYFDITDPQMWWPINEIFEEAHVVIGHNVTFDAKALHKHAVDIFNKTWIDTMVAEHLLDENGDKGLKAMAQSYLGETVVSFQEAAKAGIQSRKFAEYAMNDAEWTWRIFHMQKHKLEEQGLVPLMRDIEMPFLKGLAEMEMNGIQVDLVQVREKIARLKELIFAAHVKVLDAIGVKAGIQMGLDGSRSIQSPFDVNSPKHLRELLYDKFKLTPPGTTDTGLPSTDKDALEALKDAHPVVPLILEYRKYQKLLTAFFEPLPKFVDKDGRVRPHFNDCGTRTGRLSCNGPNLQQLPKPKADPLKTRACFVAAPGYTLVTCDYSGQEIRILAHVSQDPTLIDALNRGQDLHLVTAKKFYNLDIPDEGLITDTPENKHYATLYETERNRAKVINFGIAYGKGPYGFAQDFKISEEEAQGILDAYFEGFPKVKQAIEAARTSVIRTGSVTSITGRKRRFVAKDSGTGSYYAKASFREGFNFLIQGYAADMVRLATIEVRNEMAAHPEWGVKLLASVHDENVYEVRSDFVTEASKAIQVCFERAVKLDVPVVAKIGVGKDYAEAK